MERFKVGTRVKLTKEIYQDAPYNPFYGGNFGKIIGTVTSVSSYGVSVKWDNGEMNGYGFEDLTPIKSVSCYANNLLKKIYG